MKRKHILKSISLFLAVLMLFGALPLGVFSTEEEKVLRVLYNGEETEAVTLPQTDKLSLTTETTLRGDLAYQWQIETVSATPKWVNISDRTGSSCEVTYALVCNLLNAAGEARLRCTVRAEGETYASDPVTVTVSFTVKENVSPAGETSAVMSASPMTMRAAAPADEAKSGSAKNIYSITIHFVFENGTIADQPVELQIAEGQSAMHTIAIPRVVGYYPQLQEEYDSVTFLKAADGSAKLQLSFAAVLKAYDIYVVYLPDIVKFTVHHHRQNLLDDKYEPTPYLTLTMEGRTGDPVGDCHLELEGFHALYYEPMIIAADGSTQLEIYYDREYYLVDFDLSGGYGQEPIYIRYGSEIGVNTVSRPGYQFVAWSLLSVANGKPTAEQIGEFLFTSEKTTVTVRCNLVYAALWTLGVTTYTLVFWQENAEDNGYSYWASMTVSEDANGDPLQMGALVSAQDWISRVDTVTDEAYFTFNAVRSDTAVELKGDGSAVVNAYYTRNRYTITFQATGACTLPHNHTHTDACYLALCGKEAHVHDENCNLAPVCGQVEHSVHQNCSWICGAAEHLAHEADCLICGAVEHVHNGTCCLLQVHTHGALCCTLPEHTHSADCCTAPLHTTACYPSVGEHLTETDSASESFPTDAEEGELYTIRVWEGWSRVTYRYIHIGGLWYRYTANSGNSGAVIAPTCKNSAHHIHGDGKCTYCNKGLTAHAHGDENCGYGCTVAAHTHDDGRCVYCAIPEHLHLNNCYKDQIHHHQDYCCEIDIHTHTPDCYTCEEHVHEGDAMLLICAIPTEHTQGSNCTKTNQTNTVKLVTRKYQASLADIWPVTDDNGKTYNSGERWMPSNSSYYEQVLVYLANMPADDFTLTLNTSSQSTYTMHYMLEALPFERGDADVVEYNGRYFKKSFEVKANYSRVTKAEDFFDIKGYTQWASNPSFSNNSITISGTNKNVYFYYTRNTGNNIIFKFQNINTVVASHSGADIMYGIPLSDYRDYVPPYPTTYEPNAYEFEGWYLSAECVPGTEVNWDTLTMPDGALTVYAKWKPVQYTVDVYLDASCDPAEQLGETHTVPHGTLISEPTHPTNGNLVFAGWFYLDANGEEKAFVFNAIPVKSDMKIYAKWSSRVAVQYIIRYAVLHSDGTSTEIAAPTLGSTLAGQNRTFYAKGGDELYEGFREGFFPETTSHSLIMSAEHLNTYTFYYTSREAVPYTVRYVNAVTGEPLAADKTVPDNRLAVVTETFVPVAGYMPDSYQKRLVVSANGENNVLVFYYEKDEAHAYYRIVHYWQNINLVEYSEYSHTDLKGVIGEPCTASPISIEGFEVARVEINGTEVTADDNGNVSATLGKEGMLIAFYYDRQEVEYTVEFVDYDDPTKKLIPSRTEKGLYGTLAEEFGPDLTVMGYTNVSDLVKSITLRTTGRNVITFTYQEQQVDFHYVARVEDTILGSYGYEAVNAVSGIAAGCTSFGSIDYEFVGWYKDEACTIPVVPGVDPVSLDEYGNLTPQKVAVTVEGQTVFCYQTATYYVLFEYKYVSLTIQVTGCDDEDQTFLYHVQGMDAYDDTVNLVVAINGNGTAVIEHLRVGSYQITQVSNWSWRYEPNEIIVVHGVSNARPNTPVVFDQTRSNDQWLNGNGYTQILVPVK